MVFVNITVPNGIGMPRSWADSSAMSTCTGTLFDNFASTANWCCCVTASTTTCLSTTFAVSTNCLNFYFLRNQRDACIGHTSNNLHRLWPINYLTSQSKLSFAYGFSWQSYQSCSYQSCQSGCFWNYIWVEYYNGSIWTCCQVYVCQHNFQINVCSIANNWGGDPCWCTSAAPTSCSLHTLEVIPIGGNYYNIIYNGLYCGQFCSICGYRPVLGMCSYSCTMCSGAYMLICGITRLFYFAKAY